jgi:hypothetical protein
VAHPTRPLCGPHNQASVWPTQPPIQREPQALYRNRERLERETDHSPPYRAEVKNEWSRTSIPPLPLTTCRTLRASILQCRVNWQNFLCAQGSMDPRRDFCTDKPWRQRQKGTPKSWHLFTRRLSVTLQRIWNSIPDCYVLFEQRALHESHLCLPT